MSLTIAKSLHLSLRPIPSLHGCVARKHPNHVASTVFRPRRGRVVVKAEKAEVEKALVKTLSNVRSVCWVSFWSQIALSLSSAGLFLFTVFTAQTKTFSAVILLVGVAASFISTGIVRFILQNVRSLIKSEEILTEWKKQNIAGWLLRNSDINLVGMGASIIALQGECGNLVAKLLRTQTTTVYPTAASVGAPSSLDIFAVQGCANILLSHFVSLFFLTYMLRLLERRRRNEEVTVA